MDPRAWSKGDAAPYYAILSNGIGLAAHPQHVEAMLWRVRSRGLNTRETKAVEFHVRRRT